MKPRPKTRLWQRMRNEKKREQSAQRRQKLKQRKLKKTGNRAPAVNPSPQEAATAALEPRSSTPVVASQEVPLNLTIPSINRIGYADPNLAPIDLTVTMRHGTLEARCNVTQPRGQGELTIRPAPFNTPFIIPPSIDHHQNPIRLPYCPSKWPQSNQHVHLVKPYAINHPSARPPPPPHPPTIRPQTPLTYPIPRPAHASTFFRHSESFGPRTILMPSVNTVFKSQSSTFSVHQAAFPRTSPSSSNCFTVVPSTSSHQGVPCTTPTPGSSSLPPVPMQAALHQQSPLSYLLPFLNPPQLNSALLSLALSNPLGLGINQLLQLIHPSAAKPNMISTNCPPQVAAPSTCCSESYDLEKYHTNASLCNATKLISLVNGDTFFVHPHYGLHKLPQTMTLDKIPMSLYSTSEVQADYFHPEFLKLFADNQVIQALDQNTMMMTTGASPKPLLPESKEYKSCVKHLQQLQKDEKIPMPACSCKAEEENAPSYANLGVAPSVSSIRELIERRTGLINRAIRIKELIYTGVKASTADGCPLAEHVIRRTGSHEKYLVLIRRRKSHTCRAAWMIVAIVAWEGVHPTMADRFYTSLSHKLANFGVSRPRTCEQNKLRTCACQGDDHRTQGMSLSFGCSWSMFYNGCKYTRSTTATKFKLSQESEEHDVEEQLQYLATKLAPVYQKLAPYAYTNQVLFEAAGYECRLGRKPGRPWSGVTTCLDFCAHAHKDRFNMKNGSTVVVTLTKHRGFEKVEDEQLHILPKYIMATANGLGPGVEVRSRAEDSVNNPDENNYGGVGLSLTHGSLLFECARHELHATTALKNPNRLSPSRLSLVYYQHKNLNLRHHGFMDWNVKSQLKKTQSSPSSEQLNPTGTDRTPKKRDQLA